MVTKSTITLAGIGTVSTILLIKIFTGAFLIDFLIRLIDPLNLGFNSREVIHIAIAALITAWMSVAVMKGKINIPFIKL